jgi:hypothetical protein
VVKSPFDLAGGLFLLAIAALGFAGAFDLSLGTLSVPGAGLMPKVVASLVAAFGVLFVVQALLYEGDRLERWHLRGPAFVLGAVLLFGVVIKGATFTLGGFFGVPALGSLTLPPLGLIVAGPLAVIVSSFADRQTRPAEIAVFSIGLTLACGLLFKELLELPIPFDPAGVVPDGVADAYLGAKSALGRLADAIKTLVVR